MGNQMSIPQRVEDQENELETDSSEVASEHEHGQNGMPVVISTHSVQHYDEVDLGISVKQDNVATSSPKTMEISAVVDANGKNLGKGAKPEAAAAKSRFFLMLSGPVPGRTRDQATDSSPGSVRLDVSSNKAPMNKAPSESVALPVAAAPEHSPDKTPGQNPSEEAAFSATWGPAPLPPESAPAKPKDPSFFDRLFKLDKAREKAPIDSQQESKGGERPDEADAVPGLSRQPDDGPAEKDIGDSKEKGQEVTPSSPSVPEDPEELTITKENSQTTNIAENNNSIMSFFKTLVSPNKAETKRDPEDTGAEKSPATSADPKSDKANFIPQETQGAAKNPKGCHPPGQTQSGAPTETPKEGAKEKTGPTSLPLGKLFWKKSIKEDSVPTGAEENVVCESPVENTKSEDIEPALQTVDLNEEGDAIPEPKEEKLKREGSKPSRPSLMAFFRQMSVKGDGGITHPEEINGKDSSYQTSDSTEKAVTPPEPEPAGAGPKGKDGSSKDKKSAAETSKQKSSKQEAKEQAQSSEQSVVEMNSLQNGDKSQKKPEKRRQSLGGFLKGLGPKRMLDAQVQTDPISIGPVGKSK
ncbi:breast carcinoma-amplified sequence 1 isoform X4 [Choloepus didactylus]|uniref:breast carcinoma-amplified sequence 1 isoform X4 n=1 Tax=Choloepus didactylus TaxID=27675 RepID=UPI00189EE5B9|nr:breast carcinoma-amplified sequence 1 isoform X4 [Choloepus didactylus]